MTVTYAEWIAQCQASFKILEMIRQASQTVTDDYIALEDALIQLLEGEPDAVATIQQGLAEVRAGLDAALAAGETLADGLLLNARVLVNSPSTDPDDIVDDVYDYLVANSKTFNDRDFSRGAFSATGGNTGDGTIYRFTVDAGAFNIQKGQADVTTATIIADAAGGEGGVKTNAGQEIFRLVTKPAGDGLVDKELSGRGSGQVLETPCLSSDDSLINNPSFGTFTGTAGTPTDIESWTVTTDIGNFELDGTNYYRASVAEGSTPYALKITATDTISQLLSVSGNGFTSEAPYLCRCVFNRAVNSDTGTLVLHLGAVSKSVAVSAQTGWNVLAIDQDEDAWFDNFTEDASTDVSIAWTRTGGTGLLVDDVILAPAVEWEGDGCYVAPVGGGTNWRKGDSGTMTDTETGAVMSRWWWRTKNISFPTATGGTETESDPSVSF